MSDGSDGRHTGPGAAGAGRPGRPPVPRRLPAASAGAEDGQHPTEQVPFPLPPLPSPNAPAPLTGPETGPLYLVGYPPRVPGAGRPSPAAPAPEDPAAQDRNPNDADDDR